MFAIYVLFLAILIRGFSAPLSITIAILPLYFLGNFFGNVIGGGDQISDDSILDAIGLANSIVSTTAIAAATLGAGSGKHRREKNQQGLWAGTLGIVICFGIIVAFQTDNIHASGIYLIFIFFLLLPIVNGLWDWLSWRVSRWLGHDLLHRLNKDHQVWFIVRHALADLGFALILLATFAFVLAFAFEGYNQLSGGNIYDLSEFIERAAASPWSHGLWLTIMLLSTLLPTFIHFALLLASPLVMLVMASPKRAELAFALQGYDGAENRDAILQNVGWYLARSQYLAWAGAILLTLLLLGLLAGFFSMLHQGGLADYVARIAVVAVNIAHWCF